MAAPTSPAPLDLAPTQPKWPKVWGILMLVWAGLTALTSCCGMLSIFMTPYFGKMAGIQFPPAPKLMTYWIVGDVVISIFLVVVLVMGGMALIRRRRTAAKLAMMYASVRLLLVPISIVVGIAMEQPAADWARDIAASVVESMEKAGQKPTQAQLDAASNTKPSSFARVQSVALPIVLGIFPALLAYYITRPKSKEEMANWTA